MSTDNTPSDHSRKGPNAAPETPGDLVNLPKAKLFLQYLVEYHHLNLLINQ
jgi:hypothetical protein